MTRRQPRPTLFPYTTLFRSHRATSMPLSCPKCSSLNPDDALYCHSDGLALRAYQAPTTANRLARPFVFPSGQSCQTYDELVAADRKSTRLNSSHMSISYAVF